MAQAADSISASNSPENDPLLVAHENLRRALIEMRPPAIPPRPHPDHFLALADYVAEVAAQMDRWLKAIVQEVDSNATVKLDMSVFDGAMTGAVDSLALFEIQRAASALGEDPEEDLRR